MFNTTPISVKFPSFLKKKKIFRKLGWSHRQINTIHISLACSNYFMHNMVIFIFKPEFISVLYTRVVLEVAAIDSEVKEFEFAALNSKFEGDISPKLFNFENCEIL